MARKRDIVARVGADTSDLEKGLKRSADNLDKLADAGKKAGAVLATGITAAAAAIVGLTARGISAADAMQDVAEKLGETTAGLTTLRLMADRAGASVTGMDAAIERATRRVGEFHASGGGPAAKWIERLNLNVEDLVALRPSELFQTYSEAISGLNTRGEKFAAISSLMGDEARSLLPAMEQGAGAFQAAADEARKLGLILDETQNEQIKGTADAMDRMKDSVQGVSLQFAANFAPVITVVLNTLATLTTTVGNAVIRIYDFTRAVIGLRRASEELSDDQLAERIAAVSEQIAGINENLHPEGHGMRKTQMKWLANLNEELANHQLEQDKRRTMAEAAEMAHLSELEGIRAEANQARVEQETELEQMLFNVFAGFEEQKKELRTQEFEQMWTNLQAELEILEIQKEARGAATEQMISNLLTEVSEIEKAESQKRSARKRTTDDLIGGLSSAFNAVSGHSKKRFELAKTFAKAEAGLNAYRAIQQVWADETLPFYAKVAATAITAVQTAANLSAINSTQFGGGTTPSAGGTPTVNGNPVQAAGPTSGRLFVENVDPDALFSGRSVRALAERLQEHVKDGGTFSFA